MMTLVSPDIRESPLTLVSHNRTLTGWAWPNDAIRKGLPPDAIIGAPVVDWEAEFASAIALTPIGRESGRCPEWFVLRFMAGKERILRRLLGLIKLPYHNLTYFHQVSSKQTTERSWFPGHFFIEFDPALDYWQQVIRMPSVIEILGGPLPRALPAGMMEDLVGRLPSRIAKGNPLASVSPGQRVRIVNGVYDGNEGVVLWCGRKKVEIDGIMFCGRPTKARLDLADVVVIG